MYAVDHVPKSHQLFRRRMQRRFGAAHTYQGRSVFLVDGTGVSMPDTPALAQVFGY
ncbi:MAG: hypothetical protein ACLFV7_07530 [Phycisphaerae bacterium]